MAYLLLVTVAGYWVAQAGNLEPPTTPGPTMKTLNEIPGMWSLLLFDTTRWEIVMNGVAVLDHETGLVWEKTPNDLENSWYAAIINCYRVDVGDRRGWRLPTVEELASLVEPSSSGLPPGHPFTGISGGYWSLTTRASQTSNGRAHFVSMDTSGVFTLLKTEVNKNWCVRGGHGYTGGHF